MSDLLGVGASALNAAQRILDTIGHNIANVNTPGYSRQTTELVTRPPIRSGGGFMGTGVDISSTRRVLDQFINTSLTNNIATNQELGTFQEYVNVVDNLLADTSLGLAQGFNDFFGALNELNNHPDSVPARQVFLSQLQVLTARFKEIDTQLESLRSQANNQINNIVTEMNGLATSIADLNVDIINSGADSSNLPNDLLDQREELVNRLAKLVSVNTSVQADGALNVFIGTGQSLVIGGITNTLSVQRSDIDPKNYDILMGSSAGSGSVVVTDNLVGGQIGGVLSVSDSIITPSQNAIGRIATTMALTFNEQHQKGIDANGNQGLQMFEDPNSIDNARNRVLGSINNTGDAVFSAFIDNILTGGTGETTLFNSASNLVNAGSLSTIAAGTELNINGVSIRPTTIADDAVSSSDATASAIAIANAINASNIQHGVTASAQPNVVNLGQFTAGPLAAGEFQINGINVVTAGTNSQVLLQDINALKPQTGVDAIVDGNGNIQLVAQDGRNIQLASNTNTPVATFTHFDTNSGVALNQVKRAEVQLFNPAGTVNIAGSNPSVAGFSVGNHPGIQNSLTTSDYLLTYDGSNYALRRLNDDVVVAQGATANFQVDGFRLQLDSGTIQAGDRYIIQPTRAGTLNFNTKINQTSQLALASPVRVQSDINNQGSASIQLISIDNTSGTPAPTQTQLGNAFGTVGQLTPPIRIEFISKTTYNVYDVSQGVPGVQIGPTQSYDPNSLENKVFPISGVVDLDTPGPNPTYVYDPGYQINLQGAAQSGDVFTVGYNQDASADNQNGLLLANLQFDRMLEGGTATYQDAFGQLVGEVGSIAAKTNINVQASDTLLNSLESRRNEVSGVNLEEEAANLIKFEQYYQAAAQLISVSRDLFDVLISSFGR